MVNYCIGHIVTCINEMVRVMIAGKYDSVIRVRALVSQDHQFTDLTTGVLPCLHCALGSD